MNEILDFNEVDTFYKYLTARNGLDGKGRIKKILSSYEGSCFGIKTDKKNWANKDFSITPEMAELAWESRRNSRKGAKPKITKSHLKNVRWALTKIKDFDDKFLYLMRMTKSNYYKIGVSVCPNKRASELQTGCPTPIEIVAVWQIKDSFLCESSLHKKFSKFNTINEWFEFPREVVVERFEQNFDFEFVREIVCSGRHTTYMNSEPMLVL